MTGDVRPGHAAGTLEHPSQPPGEPPSRTAKGTGEAGREATEPPEPLPQQAGGRAPMAPHPGVQSVSSSPWCPVKEGSPRAPPGKGPAHTRTRRGGRGTGSPQQLYRLSLAGSRARPTPNETAKAPQPPEAEAPQGPGPRAHLTSSLPRAEAPPAPVELGFQRCFQESCSSFTSTNYTSPSPTPRAPLRAPRPGSASPSPSPSRPSSYTEFQGSEPGPWPAAAENSFPGANFGVHPAKPAPFPEGSRPSGSPGAVSFQYPFPELPRDATQPEFADGAVVFAFHQPPGPWQEEAVGTSPAYPLPAQPAPPPLPGYPSRTPGLDAPGNFHGVLSAPGAAPPAPNPFPASLHKSLTKAHPERPPPAQEGVASPRGPPGALPPVHFPGKAFGGPVAGGVGASPGPLDKELATSGPTPTAQTQLWDGGSEALSLLGPAAATYSPSALAPPAAPRSAFFDGQPSSGSRLCLPQSPPLPWPQVVPTAGPAPLDLLSQLPFPAGAPEWQGGSQGALGCPSTLPGPGDKLGSPRGGPGPPDSSSPALFPYHGLKDAAAQPLFFGVTQPQVSPRLPPPRVVAASPSESPLPSPATNTAGSSSCSSLSPLSSSPANPSSEESQLPGALGPAAFLHRPTRPQETGGAFASPEPLRALPIGFQPGLPETFPFPAEGLQDAGSFKCLEEAPLPSAGPELGREGLGALPRGPPPYSTHHFTLSSASLDQLDVLLTCRQCDQNFSNLAAFLGHRQFCSPLLATDGPPRPPGLPAAAPAPKAPAASHPGLLGHARTVSFLLDGDTRGEGKDDPLRTGFFPSLSAAPLPLPASELDMEDDAKLDSLITEALNGLEYQSDNPEIDSSFIDVFADEEPSGPRGPGTGPPPKARPGATADGEAQAPRPAPAPKPEPGAPCLGDEGRPPHSRAQTRSLGPAPTEAGPAGQPRRGKQLKWFREELDTASAKGAGRGARACPKPRRGRNRAEPAPPRPRDLRTQGPKGDAEPAASLCVQTRSSKRLRPPPGRDARKRRARGGTWSKELIQKIVQQKNKLSRRQVRARRGAHEPLLAAKSPPGARDGRLQAYDYASESEDEGPRRPGSSVRGRSRHGCQRRRRGDKRKEVAAAQGPREEREQETSEKGVLQEAGVGRSSLTPEEPGGPSPSPSKGPEPGQAAAEGAPPTAHCPLAAPRPFLHDPRSPKTPEENLPSPAVSQEPMSPGAAEAQPPDATELLRAASRLSPATSVQGSFPTAGPPRPGLEASGQLRPSGSLAEAVPRGTLPAPDPGGFPDAPRGPKPLGSPDREDRPTHQPGELLVLAADVPGATSPEPSTLFLKDYFSGDSLGVPVAEKGPPPSSTSPGEQFLGPADLAGRPGDVLCARPLALDTPLVSSLSLCQDSVGTSSLEPKPPREPPCSTGGASGPAESPLTLESAALFRALPEDGFDPLLYDSLSANKDSHMPFACTGLPPRKPPWDPPCPPLLPEKDWLEAGSPALPDHLGHCPGLPGGKPLGKQPPSAGTTAASPPPSPGKVSECGVAFVNSLSEDELEIKRLVSELESQLQPSRVTSGAPGVLLEAEHAACREPEGGPKPPSPLPVCQAPSPRKAASADELNALGNASPCREGAGAADATPEGTLGDPWGGRPHPASLCPGEAALPPSTRKEAASRAPSSPSGASCRVQEGRVSNTESCVAVREHGVHADVCLPTPIEQLQPPVDTTSSPRHSPNHAPSFPKSDEAPGAHPGRGLPLLLPHTWRPREAGGPSQEPPELEAPSNPIAHRTPGLAFRGDKTIPLDALAPPGASRGNPTSKAGEPEGPGHPRPVAERPCFEGNEGREAPPGPLPSPTCDPDAGSPQDPATSPLRQLQLLVARAAENKDDALASSQGPPPAHAQSPQHGEPAGSAVPAVAGCPWGPGAGGHTSQGPVGQLQLDSCGGPGRPGSLATASAKPAGTDWLGGELEGSRAGWGLQLEAQARPDGATWTPPGPAAWTPERVAGLGLKKWLPFAGETPVPPCGLELLPQEDSAPALSGARGEPPTAPPHLSSSPCGPKAGLVCCLPLEDALASLPGWKDQGSRAFTPTCGGSCPNSNILRTLEDSRIERQQGSPSPTAEAVAPRVTVQAAVLPGVPTADGREAVRGWLRSEPGADMPDPHCRGAPLPTSPGPPGHAALLGPRQGQHAAAVPADPAVRGTEGPDTHACLEGKVGGGSEGQGDARTPGAGYAVLEEAPKAGAGGPTAASPSTVTLGGATSPSSTTSNRRPDAPQGRRNVPQQMPQGAPPGPQDHKQKPQGFKKKPMLVGSGRQDEHRTPGVPLVTCEICASTFRSKPGLSRHRARKHRPNDGGASPPGQAAAPTTPARPPGKKSQKAPGTEKRSSTPASPGQAAAPSPGLGPPTPGDAQGPGTPEEVGRGSGLLPPLPDPTDQGEDAKPPAPRPRRADGLAKATARPEGAGSKRGGLRQRQEPGNAPHSAEGKSSKKGRKPSTRRERGGRSGVGGSPQISPGATLGSLGADPAPTRAGVREPPSLSHSPQGVRGADRSQPPLRAAPGPGGTAHVEERDPGAPRDLRAHRGRLDGLCPGEGPARRHRASASAFRGARGARTLGVCRKPAQAAGRKAAEDSTGASVLDGQELPGAGAGSATRGCLQEGDNPDAPSRARGSPGHAAAASGLGLGDPLGLFDDETSFSELFPLGDRLTRKKNPRVYGKRGAKPKPPAPQPSSAVGKDAQALSPRLPTDLSDSGSLCLSREGPWDDEAPGLPETFHLDGLLGTRVPGEEPWTPGPGLWTPGPSRDTGGSGTAPSRSGDEGALAYLHTDDPSEGIPELHMVPAAWRGLELRVPLEEADSSCGEESPEPPNLERERYETGPPGTASLPLLHAVDYDMLSAKFETQDLCLPGPRKGPVELPGASFLGFESTVNSQGPRHLGTPEAAGAGGAPGREWPTKARRGSYKCRVCFQRFHGLGELDLHKLAHSPSPPPTCYMCVERRFGSRQLLREHLREKHVQGKAGPWACGMCLKEVADVWMYNEHLREHAVRFARQGQARANLQGLPGCWEEDSAVTRFLSGIVGRAAEPRRGRGSVRKTSGSPGEASAQESETPRQKAKPKAHAHTPDQSGACTTDSLSAGGDPLARTSSSSAAVSPGLPPEAPLQAPPVHQACKDPSRHCHHCGKQFPKPFKLQRHLAVHSPQRVYLCPQCPQVYGEPGELQRHLGREHGAEPEPEPPHTPLYACELCAVVMHIIKRSFVCSTCNYTFAKKEQFDRHMDKHLRRGLQPFAFRRVRRPGAPGQKAPTCEDALPSKRRKVSAPGSPPGPRADRPLSPGCSRALAEPPLPALLQPSPEEAPGTPGGQAETQEAPADPAGHAPRAGDPPTEAGLWKLPPPSLSPFLATVADSEGGPESDPALVISEDKGSPGSPGPLPQQTLPLGVSLTQQEARSSQDLEEEGAPRLSSGQCRARGAPGKRGPDRSPEDPSSVWKEKPASTCHMGPGTASGDPSQKDRVAVSSPGKVPKFLPQPKKAVASARELARDTEDRPKPTPPRAKPGPSAKAEGGSQPQPASGQLQSETASTPAKPPCPGQSPTPDKLPPQAPAKGCSKGPQGSLGPRESTEGSERKRKGRAPGPARSESAGGLGRAPSVPDRPPRNPRKQTTPSRVLPPKPRPSGQIGKTQLQPGHAHGDFRRRKAGPGKGFPEARPLHRPPRKGRAVHGMQPAGPHAHRTAASQSDLLSQLFGQRLTSFKIPLKKDAAE